MTYNYKILGFNPAQFGGYGVNLKSPWGDMFLFNIKPEILDQPNDNELYFTLTKDDIRHFEISNHYSEAEFIKMTEYVNQFYKDEHFYEKSKEAYANQRLVQEMIESREPMTLQTILVETHYEFENFNPVKTHYVLIDVSVEDFAFNYSLFAVTLKPFLSEVEGLPYVSNTNNPLYNKFHNVTTVTEPEQLSHVEPTFFNGKIINRYKFTSNVTDSNLDSLEVEKFYQLTNCYADGTEYLSEKNI